MNQDFFYKSLVDSLPDMVWAFDKEYKICMANSAFKDMRMDLYMQNIKIGDSLFDGVPENVVAKWKPIYDRALKGERIIMDDKRLINGIEVMASLGLNPVYNEQGEVFGCVGITYDITKVNELEAKVNFLEAKCLHIKELTELKLYPQLGRFYNLSDQFKNTSDFSLEDKSAMILMLQDELTRIGAQLKEISRILNNN